jgi:hypothetical protein
MEIMKNGSCSEEETDILFHKINDNYIYYKISWVDGRVAPLILSKSEFEEFKEMLLSSRYDYVKINDSYICKNLIKRIDPMDDYDLIVYYKRNKIYKENRVT